MPPPVTPSPHRFVIKKQPPVRKTPLAQEQTPRPTEQFNATPRFNFSSTPKPTPSQTVSASTPAVSRYLTPARLSYTREEIIDTFSDGLQDVQDSIETDDQDLDAEYLSDDGDDYRIEEPTPKRRRLSSSPMLLEEANVDISNETIDLESSPLPLLSSPPAPRVPVSRNAPKFLISTPAPPSTPQATSTLPTFLKPPRFRPPDPPEQSQTQAEPLPEQFSPHRRGQKYIPGGLAAEVRGWLMNIESTTPANAAQKKDDPWIVKLVIDEVTGGGKAGMTLVRGRKVSSVEDMLDTMGVVQVLLAGEGAGTGLQRGSKVEVGKTVGIKRPVWEVVIEGEKWGVGVDWKNLA